MLSSGGTTKRLDRLESAGLIQRHPDPNDRRGTLIALTGAGFDLINVSELGCARGRLRSAS
jgi:DNA-binding MarR family transcriptional regulator